MAAGAPACYQPARARPPARQGPEAALRRPQAKALAAEAAHKHLRGMYGCIATHASCMQCMQASRGQTVMQYVQRNNRERPAARTLRAAQLQVQI